MEILELRNIIARIKQSMHEFLKKFRHIEEMVRNWKIGLEKKTD